MGTDQEHPGWNRWEQIRNTQTETDGNRSGTDQPETDRNRSGTPRLKQMGTDQEQTNLKQMGTDQEHPGWNRWEQIRLKQMAAYQADAKTGLQKNLDSTLHGTGASLQTGKTYLFQRHNWNTKKKKDESSGHTTNKLFIQFIWSWHERNTLTAFFFLWVRTGICHGWGSETWCLCTQSRPRIQVRCILLDAIDTWRGLFFHTRVTMVSPTA